mmetsp:Transcript_54202/g.100152  ORF Transcript_54202/g.100152 Transcript_54202/m.100152 type:complete len:395 (-) Transcript_54202:78-1262(-)
MDLTCQTVLSQDGAGAQSSLAASSRSIEVLPDVDFTPLTTLRSPLRSPGPIGLSVDHVLQSLLVHGSLMEEDVASEAESSDVASARSISELSQDGEANELFSSLSGPIAALRAMRRSGPLAEISPEGQLLLLGGTLYEYNNNSDNSSAATAAHTVVDTPVHTGHQVGFESTVAMLEASLNSVRPHSLPRVRGLGGLATGIEAPTSLAASLVSTPSARSVSLSGVAEDLDGAPSDVSLQESVYSMAHEQTRRQDGRYGDESLNSTARTVMSGTIVPERTGHGAAVTSMLRQLVRETAIDESIARSAARVLQMGTVLAGERLSDDEIARLPKARFDQVEEQSCPICLEVYKQGELLNLLACQHFFHISCLASWFQRSTQCPLCRMSCGGQDTPKEA